MSKYKCPLSDCDGTLMFKSPTDKIVVQLPNGVKVRVAYQSDNTLVLNIWKLQGNDISDWCVKHFSSITIDDFPTLKVKI